MRYYIDFLPNYHEIPSSKNEKKTSNKIFFLGTYEVWTFVHIQQELFQINQFFLYSSLLWHAPKGKLKKNNNGTNMYINRQDGIYGYVLTPNNWKCKRINNNNNNTDHQKKNQKRGSLYLLKLLKLPSSVGRLPLISGLKEISIVSEEGIVVKHYSNLCVSTGSSQRFKKKEGRRNKQISSDKFMQQRT